MNYKNLIAHHPQAIPTTLCKKTISHFDENEKFDSAIADEGKKVPEFRKSKEAILSWDGDRDAPNSSELCSELCNFIKPLVDDYYKKYVQCFKYIRSTRYEDAHVLKYEPNNGFYHYHYDSDGGDIGNRIISIIIYLNDVEEGGETEFSYINEGPIKPNQGDVIIFPSGPTHTHRGKIPVSNSKYIAVFWLREDS
tara:strand:+ start:142 stop:726 length:585 start_codon:yes stop_codon:yes gene_type:complete